MQKSRKRTQPRRRISVHDTGESLKGSQHDYQQAAFEKELIEGIFMIEPDVCKICDYTQQNHRDEVNIYAQIDAHNKIRLPEVQGFVA